MFHGCSLCSFSHKHGRQSLDFAELPVMKFQGDNKELHITSHRAYFAKLNLLSCFLREIQYRALSSPPQELHIILLLSVPIVLSHYSLPFLYSVLLCSIQYICILIIFDNIDEKTLCSCFRIVVTIG